MSIALSYVLTTYNKLDYLKVTLPVLIQAAAPDEEIVIVDGGSSDGTPAYLENLKKEGKIHQFISEKDKGESHGTNKGILMARGELIKIITDDDAYYFPAINRCGRFMLENPGIDVLGFDGFGFLISSQQPVFNQMAVVNDFRKWKQTREPFIFCGLSLLFRRSSVPLLGLFSTTVKMIDLEYTMRITTSKINMAWYTGLAYVNIANENSNSIKDWKLSMIEREKCTYFYKGQQPAVSFKTKDAVKEVFRPIKRMLFGKVSTSNTMQFTLAYESAMKRLQESDSGWEILS